MERIEAKNTKKLAVDIVKVDKATENLVLSRFKGPLAGLFKVGPEKWIMPIQYPICGQELYNFEARPADIWISTFVRSGTTLTQEIVWLLCNDLNYDAAKATQLNIRFPFFELDSFLSAGDDRDDVASDSMLSKLKELMPPASQLLAEMASPRLIKTHFPITLMPHDALASGCKIVYVARCPTDVVVSLFHFAKIPGFGYIGTFDEFVDFFMQDLLIWGPYFEHLKDAWNRRNDSNILFMFYEDLVMDLRSSLLKLASFLGRPLSENDLPELMEHLHFTNFKQNSSVNMKFFENLGMGEWSFIRRGQIGRNPEITAEIAAKIDAWTNEKLKGTGLTFPHQ